MLAQGQGRDDFSASHLYKQSAAVRLISSIVRERFCGAVVKDFLLSQSITDVINVRDVGRVCDATHMPHTTCVFLLETFWNSGLFCKDNMKCK